MTPGTGAGTGEGTGPGAFDPRLPRAIDVVSSLDPAVAAAAIAAFAMPLEPALVLLFASPAAAFGPALAALAKLLPAGCRCAGASSAGELLGGGYVHDRMLAVVFPAAGFSAELVLLPDLGRSEVTRWMPALAAARERLGQAGRSRMVGLALADGGSRREDVLAAALDAAMPDLPVIGGFAGNGLSFAGALVGLDGQVHADVAVIGLLATDLPVEEVVFAHFAATDQRAVVTAIDSTGHAILELNAEPAAEEYGRLICCPADRLTPVDFARHPLLMRIGRRLHVRAISGVRPDGGLQLMSAVDLGAVLRLGRAEDMIQGFQGALEALPRPPALLLGFDCILRRLALEEAGLHDAVAGLARRFNIRGFNTYGELHGAMHVNQTFVGVAFLPPPAEAAG